MLLLSLRCGWLERIYWWCWSRYLSVRALLRRIINLGLRLAACLLGYKRLTCLLIINWLVLVRLVDYRTDHFNLWLSWFTLLSCGIACCWFAFCRYFSFSLHLTLNLRLFTLFLKRSHPLFHVVLNYRCCIALPKTSYRIKEAITVVNFCLHHFS